MRSLDDGTRRDVPGGSQGVWLDVLHHPLKVERRVRIPYGLLLKFQSRGRRHTVGDDLFCSSGVGDRPLNRRYPAGRGGRLRHDGAGRLSDVDEDLAAPGGAVPVEGDLVGDALGWRAGDLDGFDGDGFEAAGDAAVVGVG